MFSKSKPDPQCFELCLKELGLHKDEVIIVEDSVAGVRAAREIGCRVFGLLTYLSADDLCTADKVFKDHYGILGILTKTKPGNPCR